MLDSFFDSYNDLLDSYGEARTCFGVIPVRRLNCLFTCGMLDNLRPFSVKQFVMLCGGSCGTPLVNRASDNPQAPRYNPYLLHGCAPLLERANVQLRLGGVIFLHGQIVSPVALLRHWN